MLEHHVVAVTQLAERAVDQPRQARARGILREDLRCHHGGQRQRDKTGKRHRGGHGDGELGEQAADVALQERDRHEHGDQRHGGGNDGKADLARAAEGRDQPCLAVILHAPVDVLEHHDGVVHHQADGQHQRQQGQDVDRETEGQQHHRGGDQGDRHGDGGYQHGADAAEEQVDHADHHGNGDGQGFVDLADRPLDEHRAVVALLDGHALRQCLVDAVLFRLGGPGDRQRVGCRLLGDADAYHRHAVTAEKQPVFRRAALDACHVAEPNQVAVRAARQHQPRKVVGTGEDALGAYRELALLGVDAAGREFQVLGAQRSFHVCHGEVARGQRAAVQPDTHGIYLSAAHAYPGHPVQHREAVDQVASRIIGQFRDAHARALQVEPHDHILVAVLLADVRGLGLDGQVIEDRGDTVADIVRRGVDVVFHVELDGDARAAVLADRGDVADAFHPGDAVLDQLGNAVFHHVGGRPGIGGGDGDDGRVDVRVFAQRQAVKRDQPEGNQQQRHDCRKHGAPDRDVGKDHLSGLPPGRARSSSASGRVPSSTAVIFTG